MGYQEPLGSITGNSFNTVGLNWKAVRPNGNTITSGTTTFSISPPYAIGDGVFFRLQSEGNYMGFVHKGPWAVSPFYEKNYIDAVPYDPSALCHYACYCRTPVEVTMLLQSFGLKTFEGNDRRVFTTGSALDIPQKSTITVKNSNGTAIPNMPVLIVNSGCVDLNGDGNVDDPSIYQLSTFICNTEVRNTDATGKVQYCIPNYIYSGDYAAYTVTWPPLVEAGECKIQVECGQLLVLYKGFYHGVSLPANVSAGTDKTITVPADSVVTVSRLGSPRVGQSVGIVNADVTEVISNQTITTDATGQAAFAVPSGQQFRFLAQDTNGNYSWSQILTAPANGTVNMIVQNTPTLTSPSNNASFSTSSSVSFSWSSVSGAAKYAWCYRHSSASSFNGYITTTNSFNNVQFNAGTWYWFVQALDASNNVIAESAQRAIVVTNSSTASSALPKNLQSKDLLASNQLNDHSIKVIGRDLIAAESIPVTKITERKIGKDLVLENKNYLAFRHSFDGNKNKFSLKVPDVTSFAEQYVTGFKNVKFLPVSHTWKNFNLKQQSAK
jgi:hypothetical protein